MGKKKLKAGLFSMTCCEGCVFALFELNQMFPKILDFVEIVESRVLRETNPEQELDIAFVEGAIVSRGEIEKLEKIRERTKFLVALGACATIAGIPGQRNALPEKIQAQLQSKAIKKPLDSVHKLSDFVKVDFELQGCSISHSEFLRVLLQFYHKFIPRLEDIPVCKECKENQNQCLLLKGIPCLGPVTYAGCDALCPTQNAQCIGCRGFTKDANFESLRDLFREMNVSEQEIKNLFTYFNADPFKKEAKNNA
ncbi:MAG: hypothetical protein JW772_05765 [Candidatus Diapherotrites archaeon]|nr:hypothetical protein [Candidatus Diapherotrites archaeon]